jgi:transposase
VESRVRGNLHARFGRRPGETERSKHRYRPPSRPHLGTQVVDEVRRRVQHDTLGRRGHKDDPLYKIRGLLRCGVEHLTERQQAKLTASLDAGDPTGEVNVAWQRYQQLRSIYHASTGTGRRICQQVLDSFPNCPIPKVARLGRTLRAWKQQVLASFDTGGVSNGGTEAINLIIEKTRRLAHGFEDFGHYRLRILLAASGNRAYRKRAQPCSSPKSRFNSAPPRPLAASQVGCPRR